MGMGGQLLVTSAFTAYLGAWDSDVCGDAVNARRAPAVVITFTPKAAIALGWPGTQVAGTVVNRFARRSIRVDQANEIFVFGIASVHFAPAQMTDLFHFIIRRVNANVGRERQNQDFRDLGISRIRMVQR